MTIGPDRGPDSGSGGPSVSNLLLALPKATSGRGPDTFVLSSLASWNIGSWPEGGASPGPAVCKRLTGLLGLEPGAAGELGAELMPGEDVDSFCLLLAPWPGLGRGSGDPPTVARLLLPAAGALGREADTGSFLKDTRLSARPVALGSGADGAASVPEMWRWLVRASGPDRGPEGLSSGWETLRPKAT